MKKYLISLVGLLVFFSCSTNKNSSINKDRFVKFTNSNKTNIKLDEEVIKDKDFTLQIPNSLITQKSSISDCFSQDLKFRDDQRIIILYIPDKKYVLNKATKNYSVDGFTNELKKLEIFQKLKDVKLIKNRYFDIVLYENNFFVMYLNIEEKNVQDFNYSINSLKL